jgi:hypothetical protein
MSGQRILISLVVLVTVVSCTAMAGITLQASIETGTSVYKTGSIYVASTPSGASAILDGGARYLSTPGTFTGIDPGTHVVKVTRQGFFPKSSTVKVTAGSTENVIVTLDPVSNPGGLSISSEPRGASLYVDDRYMGKTNQVVGNLAPGTHAVRISEAGYVAWEKDVTVTGGAVAQVSAILEPEVSPLSGDILVASTPPGAAVYIDGDYRGLTIPDDLLDINDLSPGQHELVVMKPGYQVFSAPVSVEAGQIVQVLAPLASTYHGVASAEIASNPAGADVFVNSVYVGVTPLSFNDIPPGDYTVNITMEGYLPFSTSGQVARGQDIHVFASLSPLAIPQPVESPTQKAPVGLLTILASGIIIVIALYPIKRA